MSLSPTQVVLAATLLVALGFVWYYEGRGRWRTRLEDRFVYGIPWGTLVTVTIVVSFYVLAQAGARQWGDPLTLPYVTWSYFYPTGIVTSGIAHGGPGHLVSNMAGTLAVAPIVEYAWSHYPKKRGLADSGNDDGLLARALVRAVVVFPLALLSVAFVTAVFSLGPGLGFSGAVFALIGFAVVTYPLPTVVAVVVSSALGTLYNALSEPVVREVVEVGTPAPPGWAGIAFQAHLFGFLLGVLLAIALLHYRGRRPSTERVFFAMVTVGMAQALWLVAWPGGDDVYFLYRGAGVTFVLLLTILVTIAVTGSDRALLDRRPLAVLPRAPSRRQLAVVWLGLVVLLAAISIGGTIIIGELVGLSIAMTLVAAGLLSIPAVPPLVPDRWFAGPVSRRQTAIVCLTVLTLLVALPSIPISLTTVGDDAVPGDGGVEIEDYTITYEQDAASGQVSVIDLGGDDVLAGEQTGVIVVSDERELWTVGVREEVLEFEGSDTAVVGGVGWHETVRAERSGWDVVGNESAYVVDLTHDGETTRSFTSEPVRADVLIDGQAVEVVPEDNEFRLRVLDDGTTVDAIPIPAENGTATAAGIEFATEPTDDGARVVAETASDRFPIAERETYS
ncbi:rhomboid family intramembrane serine protease [Natranaeroarchaeum aerophilus]|uniref:Rhomboid family intramembrane serine protease n=1 Tax=Natranaeroarchaeum aerophilus TaxID=2917711 RepID=A0AAE3K474_9EURY|nr:rhomboid family intramembrane serine protease [Natranaeroarchaeum aerophilus]MCL9813222.1 rhomboid family intramembrane serine protease [Natranaeroarchaeum aerophilus]